MVASRRKLRRTGREYFKFEDEVKRYEGQVIELEKLHSITGICFSHDIDRLKKGRKKRLKRAYSNLGAWQTVQVARHPGRPVMMDYIDGMVNDFREMHGDRRIEDDRALIGGLGKIGRYKVMVIGHNKTRDEGLKAGANEDEVREYLRCYTGSPNPGGFRKALRLMKLAEKFGIPIVSLIDTAGAFPGVEAEERGQAKAIADNLVYMPRVKVPFVSVITGEGGSGGALGIGVGDRLAMLEHSYYSVISPEGCAGILWKDGREREKAAEALKLKSKDNLELRAVDYVIAEPLGGAHRDIEGTVNNVRKYIVKELKGLSKMKVDKLIARRAEMIDKRASGPEKKKRFFWR